MEGQTSSGDTVIPIRNIYYMLAYAFRDLRKEEYRKCETEEFDNTSDLMSEILMIAVGDQLRRGIPMGYRTMDEDLTAPRGRIDIASSLKKPSMERKVRCVYDQYIVDTDCNRIIKSALRLVSRQDIADVRKARIHRMLRLFRDVGTIDPRRIDWRDVGNHADRSYSTLLSICRMTIEGLLPSESEGDEKFLDFDDMQERYHLYERFIKGYYAIEHLELEVSSPTIEWDSVDVSGMELPTMHADIVLAQKDRRLIIDAKYYGRSTSEYHGKTMLNSQNLYQIYTYVQNLSASGHVVSGMLLYAGTDSPVQPCSDHIVSGNRISVRTLDLDCEFAEIRRQLDYIAADFLHETA